MKSNHFQLAVASLKWVAWDNVRLLKYASIACMQEWKITYIYSGVNYLSSEEAPSTHLVPVETLQVGF